MKAYILAVALAVSAHSFAETNLPSYIQVQVDNLNLQISQLKAERDQMMKQIQATDPTSMEHQQLQAQIERLNNQISMLEKQADSLKKE